MPTKPKTRDWRALTEHLAAECAVPDEHAGEIVRAIAEASAAERTRVLDELVTAVKALRYTHAFEEFGLPFVYRGDILAVIERLR